MYRLRWYHRAFTRYRASNKCGWENKPFSGFKRQYLENGRRYAQSYYEWLTWSRTWATTISNDQMLYLFYIPSDVSLRLKYFKVVQGYMLLVHQRTHDPLAIAGFIICFIVISLFPIFIFFYANGYILLYFSPLPLWMHPPPPPLLPPLSFLVRRC